MTSGYQIALKYPKCPPDGLEINPKSLPHGSKSTPNAQGVAKNCPGGSKMCSKWNLLMNWYPRKPPKSCKSDGRVHITTRLFQNWLQMTVEYSQIKLKYQMAAQQVPRKLQKVLKTWISNENGLPELTSNDIPKLSPNTKGLPDSKSHQPKPVKIVPQINKCKRIAVKSQSEIQHQCLWAATFATGTWTSPGKMNAFIKTSRRCSKTPIIQIRIVNTDAHMA